MSRVSVDDFDFDRDEIERRKQLIRDLWAGKALDHVPVIINVTDPEPAYSIRDQYQDASKQLQAALRAAGLSWQSVRDGDYIPAMRPDVGCSCLATAFGAELFWGDDPNQTCGVREPVLTDVRQSYDLRIPAPDAGQLAEGIRRVKLFAEAGEGLVAVSLLDMAGGLNVASDLVGCEALYCAMHEAPEALECLLGKIQQLFSSAVALQIEAAGGQDMLTTTDFPDFWFPEGCKGHVSDDISANLSPAMYRRFSLSCHNRIFTDYGAGGLHNCGPHPCLECYLEHSPAPRAIDMSYSYSMNDLPRIKAVCRKRAIVYLLDFPSELHTAVQTYRQIMELMTPDVVVIPILATTIRDEPESLHRCMRVISEEYARRMDWGWQ